MRDAVAAVLGLDPTLVRGALRRGRRRVRAEAGLYVEFLLVAKAAQALDRPVKWAETRSENMLAMAHGRAQVHYAELGLKRDGTIIGSARAHASATPAPTRRSARSSRSSRR